jgi:hypothetical protein
MSKKDLSRSVIEGGRYKGNKEDRYTSNAEERARVRNYIQEVTLDPENYEEYDVEPRDHVYKSFKDKLAPMYRWLRSQVGRPWDEVRAAVSKEFDTRTTAGRHIVHDHLLNSVQVGEEPRYRWSSVPEDPTASHSDHDFYVDDEGILRKKRYLGRRRYRNYKVLPAQDMGRLINWLGNRIVGRVGDKFFWFVPTGRANKHRRVCGNTKYRLQWGRPQGPYSYADYGFRWEYWNTRTVYQKNSVGQVIYQNGNPIVLKTTEVWSPTDIPSLRQDRRLTDEEIIYWNSLPAHYQTKILEQSPNYPPPPKKDLYSGYYY